MRDHNWVSKSAKLGGSNRYQRDAVLGGATCLKYNDCLYCADCSMGGGGRRIPSAVTFILKGGAVFARFNHNQNKIIIHRSNHCNHTILC